MEGTLYTWCNKRHGDSFVRAKLNRCFGNIEFMQNYEHSYAHTHPRVTSDHHVVLYVFKSKTHSLILVEKEIVLTELSRSG